MRRGGDAPPSGDPRAYSERNALQKWLADQHLADLRLDGSERVLDVGCGDGKVTAEIGRLGGEDVRGSGSLSWRRPCA